MRIRNKFSMAVVLACAMFAVASTTLARERSRPLKVLAIGNSFSLSLMAQLPECARALPGAELDFAMLVIGGCSLKRHWENITKWNEGSATVNFMRNFLALSKDVDFHPCASAQGRDSKEDEGVRDTMGSDPMATRKGDEGRLHAGYTPLRAYWR